MARTIRADRAESSTPKKVVQLRCVSPEESMRLVFVGETYLTSQLRCTESPDNANGACKPCSISHTPCEWRGKATRLLSLQQMAETSTPKDGTLSEGRDGRRHGLAMPAMSAIPMYASHSHNTAPADTPSTFPHHAFPQPTLFQPSELGNIKQLLMLYFKTVHRV